jgi:hypothetical protein
MSPSRSHSAALVRTIFKGALAATLAAALPVSAQVINPPVDYTDAWWAGAAESGWGVNIVQHAGSATASARLVAAWFTFDPRAPDPTTADTTDFQPLWILLSGCTFTSNTSCNGPLFVDVGTPFAFAWNQAAHANRQIGTATLSWSDANNATFTYNVNPPAGLPATDPAFGLPAFSGSKAITRIPF